MKQVYVYDSDGFFVGVALIEDDATLPPNCTEKKPQDGLFKAKFVNGEWVETKSQDEIDSILNAPKPKSELDILKENQTLIQQALDDLILGGAL
jgi:hypothetical protein